MVALVVVLIVVLGGIKYYCGLSFFSEHLGGRVYVLPLLQTWLTWQSFIDVQRKSGATSHIYEGTLPRVPIGTVGLQMDTRVYKDNWS